MSRPGSVRALALAGSLALSLTPVTAQTRQYTPPGGAADDRQGRREALEAAVEEARWDVGPLRLDPAFWISDLSWVDDPAGGADADLTARVGAGLRGYLPLGSRTTIAAYALPEYVWWKDRSDENRLNQRFGVGAFTYFNRLEIELTAARNEEFGFVTGELYERVTGRTDRLGADLEVPVLRKLALHARAGRSRFEAIFENAEVGARFIDLNREETSLRGGVRYYPTEKLRLGAGVGRSETDFADEALDRSNSGDTWYAEIAYDRPKLGLALDFQRNELVGDAGSAFGRFDGDTRAAQVEWRPRDSFRLRLYGSRALAYSLLIESQSAYLDERAGVGVNLKLGWRLALDLYVESGTQSYEAELGGTDAEADVQGYGATFNLQLGRRLELRLGYRRSEIDAVAGVGAREIEEIRGALDFGLGGGNASWF